MPYSHLPIVLTTCEGSSDASEWCATSQRVLQGYLRITAYNAFTRYGRSSSWCKAHALNFRAMSRAVSVRSQLSKYMMRFDLPKQSCEGDAKRLRQCLVSGYWQNAARWMADGTYRSVQNNQVSVGCLSDAMDFLLPKDAACSSNVRAVYPEAPDRVGDLPRAGRD